MTLELYEAARKKYGNAVNSIFKKEKTMKNNSKKEWLFDLMFHIFFSAISIQDISSPDFPQLPSLISELYN